MFCFLVVFTINEAWFGDFCSAKAGLFGRILLLGAEFVDVERLVRKLKELLHRHFLACICSGAHRDGESHVTEDDLAHCRLYVLHESAHSLRIRGFVHCSELIARISAEEEGALVDQADLLKLGGNRTKDLVALLVAVNIIDELEFIKVHHDEVECLIFLALGHIFLHSAGKIGIKSVSVVKSSKVIYSNLVILESYEHDEYTGGDAETVESDNSAHYSLHNAEHNRKAAEPENAVAHTLAADGLHLKIVYQHLEDHQHECDVLKCEGDPISLASGVDVVRADGVYEAGKEVYDKHDKGQRGGCIAQNAAADLVLINAEDGVEEAEPLCTEQRGKKYAEEHGNMVTDPCSREGMHIENIAEHICDQARQGKRHKADEPKLEA